MQHTSLASGRWQKLDLSEQLGNIGSEVGRALQAKTVADKRSAALRALELFDMTLADKRWYGRGSEVSRAREVFCDYLFGNNIYHTVPESLERYFMQFAMAVRAQR